MFWFLTPHAMWYCLIATGVIKTGALWIRRPDLTRIWSLLSVLAVTHGDGQALPTHFYNRENKAVIMLHSLSFFLQSFVLLFILYWNYKWLEVLELPLNVLFFSSFLDDVTRSITQRVCLHFWSLCVFKCVFSITYEAAWKCATVGSVFVFSQLTVFLFLCSLLSLWYISL